MSQNLQVDLNEIGPLRAVSYLNLPLMEAAKTLLTVSYSSLVCTTFTIDFSQHILVEVVLFCNCRSINFGLFVGRIKIGHGTN